MKIAAGAADRFCAAPDQAARAVLLFGDGGVVEDRRARLVATLGLGDSAFEAVRLPADEARRDPAALDAALRTRSFFGGGRCVVLEGAGDGLTPVVEAAFAALDGTVRLIVTAGGLRAGARLRKLFETRRDAAAIACHAAAPDDEAIREHLAGLGAPAPDREGMTALRALAETVERGAFWRELDKLALYKGDDPAPLAAEDVRRSGPADLSSTLDTALDALAEGRPEAVRAALARLAAQGVGPDAIAAAALRRFRALAAASAIRAREGGDAEAALGRLKPPVRWPLSRILARQMDRWDPAALEAALAGLVEAHAVARAGGAAPHLAALERRLIRIALSARR